MSAETDDNTCPNCGSQKLTLRCSIMVHSDIAPKVVWADDGPVVEGYYNKHDGQEEVHHAELECIDCNTSWSSNLDAHGATFPA